MIRVRPSNARGAANFGWLDSRHTFSFGNYYDPEHMGFASLRVINEDIVQPSRGFDTHGHRDMEIITYVLDGALEHKDSIGNGAVMRPGDVQRMTAGTGILHSEYNASDTDPVHLLQIWILPGERGLEPGYEQTYFAPEEKQGRLRLVASPEGKEGSVVVHQDVNLYATVLSEGETVEHAIAPNRAVWLQVARGSLQVNDQTLSAGDGAAIAQEDRLILSSRMEGTEALLFDMAA